MQTKGYFNCPLQLLLFSFSFAPPNFFTYTHLLSLLLLPSHHLLLFLLAFIPIRQTALVQSHSINSPFGASPAFSPVTTFPASPTSTLKVEAAVFSEILVNVH
jgi:hypothetical protein